MIWCCWLDTRSCCRPSLQRRRAVALASRCNPSHQTTLLTQASWMEAFTTVMREPLVHRAQGRVHPAHWGHRVQRAGQVHPEGEDPVLERDPVGGRGHLAEAGNRPSMPLSLTLQRHRMLQQPAAPANAYSASAGTYRPRDRTAKACVQLTAASTPKPEATSALQPRAAAATTANRFSTRSAEQPKSSTRSAATATDSAATSGKTQTTTGL